MVNDILYPLRCLHGRIHEYFLQRRERKEFIKTIYRPIKKKVKENPEIVFLVMTPEHGNIGDHAIAFAEKKMLQEAMIPYIEVTGRQLNKLKEYKILNVMDGKKILINGGGNLGTLWFNVETLQRDIMISNPDSPIFILPNTIYYEDSEWGKEQLRESIRIYNSHEQLCLYARENVSYEKMKKIYRNVQLIPDMVLSLNECKADTKRSGCILLLRKDVEKTLTEDESNLVISQAKEIFGEKLTFSDMCVNYEISIENRQAEVDKKLEEIRGAELVITDRLHGMIFCAVTGTSCIVLDSKSPKVRGCYDWIKQLEYIRFAENPIEIKDVYNKLPKGQQVYDNENLIKYYRKLISDIV